MKGPLTGLRILDFTWFLAGPFATMILADLGADVVKVEAPKTGDPSRKAGPFIGTASAYFQSVNRGKRSITVDLKSEQGRRIARRLARQADVLVENFTPGTMERWSLDFESLEAENPRLVYASCSGFGNSGPRQHQPAFDVIIQALAGTMSITGEPGGAPTRVGFSIGDLGAGLFLVIGILAALESRRDTGRGQRVETSLFDAQLALLENAFSRYFATGEIPGPIASRHPLIVPFQAFPSADGQIVISAGTEEQWDRLGQALDASWLNSDERFSTNRDRLENIDELEEVLSSILIRHPTAFWLQRLESFEVPCSPIQNIAEAARDPQVAARHMLVELMDPEHGSLRFVNNPLQFSQTPAGVRATAPALGSDRDAVLEDWLGESEGRRS